MSPSAASLGSSGFSSVFSEVSLVSTGDAEGPGVCQSVFHVAEEVGEGGVGNGGSGYTIMVDVETLLDAFFGGIQTWDYFPQLLKYQDFQSISNRVKGIQL
jgi:hypothetical protein